MTTTDEFKAGMERAAQLARDVAEARSDLGDDKGAQAAAQVERSIRAELAQR